MSNEIERALAALAVDHNAISATSALRLIRDARSSSRPLADLVRDELPEADLLKAIAKEMGLRFYDMHATEQEFALDERVLRRCDLRMLTTHAALPLVDRTGRVVVAMANPLDSDILTYLRSKFAEGFAVALVPKAQVLSRLLYLANDYDSQNITASATMVPDWVDFILNRAVAEGASDVLLRFLADESLLVRLRVDGVLRQVRFPDLLRGREDEVVAALLAKSPTIDSSNTREPQDGTFSFQAGGRTIDCRVGTLPQVTGSNVSVRILDSMALRRRPEDMGFAAPHIVTMRDAVASPQGCVIVAGPTGSGKSTTLYTMLREVDAMSRNVLTVEDPVEYRLPYVGQTQIRENLGERSLGWERALRAIVRQDPDVILVGEIRDRVVAQVAMEASITGHLVLTTLHAPNAPGVYLRLLEMGVQRFMASDAISLIISQRLVRQVHECVQMSPPTPDEVTMLERWGVSGLAQVPHPVGCTGCAGQGFRGRLAVAEVLTPSLAVRTAVAEGAPKEVLLAKARDAGWQPIVEDGLRLLRAGRTTVAELVRVLSIDEDYSAAGGATPTAGGAS